MKIAVIIIGVLCCCDSSAQQRYNFDSLTNIFCQSFTTTAGVPDSLRIDKIFEQHSDLFENKSEKEAREIASIIYLRLQRNCPDFDRISEITNKNEEEGITIQKALPSRANSKTCLGLFRKHWFYYLEGESKVRLYITDSSWKSIFPDGTHSFLSLKKTNNCEFIITYVESNNYIISNSLKKGDQFRYRIIEELPYYFSLTAEDIATNKKQLFKLYK